MSWVVGIDGCPQGWMAAGQKEHGGKVTFKFLPNLLHLEEHFSEWKMVGIDMPIGLSDSGRRAADIEARTFVGPRASSVFPALIRPVLTYKNYTEGCNLALLLAGFKFSKQAWMLRDKIVEVDEFLMTQEVRDKVYEVHPEVSFAVLNQGVLPYRKRSEEGLDLRLSLLENIFPGAYESAREEFTKSQASHDDILDALAALWSAWRVHEGRARFFPAEPFEHDSAGRRMVIAA